MIKTAIRQTALTSQRADEFFKGKIEAARMNDDVSMAATCRLLFGPRLKDDESIRVTNDSFVMRDGSTFDFLKERVSSMKSGDLIIYTVMRAQGVGENWRDEANQILEGSGLYAMDDIMKFMDSHKMKALVYTNKPHIASEPKSPFDNDRTVIVIEGLNATRWHMIQLLLRRLMGKWFYEQPFTAEETEGIINGLHNDNVDAYLEAVRKYADTLDFRSGFIRQQLNGFEKRFEKERITQLEHRCNSITSEMNNLMEKLGRKQAEHEEIVATLYGYRMNGVDSEPHVMNYFLRNKNLVLKSCSADTLDFFVSGWFDNWNPDAAKQTFEKERMGSWLESNSKFGIPDDDAKILYKAIFIHETVRVRLWSHFKLALRNSGAVSVHSNDRQPEEFSNALPNPHHYYNSCLGNNTSLIVEAMRVRDITGAIEQCISATKGINLMEYASYNYFARDLFDPKNGSVIYVKDLDKFMTTKDAIAYLKGGSK